MAETTIRGWNVTTERGPDWLFVRFHDVAENIESLTHFSDAVWMLLERHFIYRLVLEFDELPGEETCLRKQLADLRGRIESRGGVLRLAELSEAQVQSLHFEHTDDVACFGTRADAVWAGPQPHRPK